MPYALKYFMNYKDNASGLPVVVNIYFPDFDGVALELIPADQPCIVSESNNDQSLFSAIRAKQFVIKFVTDNLVYPGINEFATNNDNDWKIDVVVNGLTWLTGFILTDQISEGWYTDNTKHYIELVATDNLGTLKKLPLLNISGESYIPTTKQFLIDIVKGALKQAIDGLVINIFDNLFETSFTDRTDTVVNSYTTSLTAIAPHQFVYLIDSNLIHPGDTLVITGSVSNDGSFTVVAMDRTQSFAFITVAETVVTEANTQVVTMEVTHITREIDSYQQCVVDMRTFTENYDSYSDAYTVLTKILESRNSVLFQHLGEWYIVRISELFRVDVISGSKYYANGVIDPITNASWTADAAQDGDLIPVEQAMLKSFLNPVLSNKVIYNYRNFDEFFCNEVWKRGAIQIDTDPLKEYDVDCWSHYQGAIISTTPSSVLFRRRDIIDSATDTIAESYIYLQHETGSGGESFIRSEGTQVSSDDRLTFHFSRRLKNAYTGGGNEILARVLLYADDGTFYTLDDDGLWYLSNSTFSINSKSLSANFSGADDRSKWFEKTVESDFLPKSGILYLLLYEGSANLFTGQETQFKDLKITYLSYLAGRHFVNVEGDYNKLTLATSLKDTAEYEVFLSDSPKYLFKGALFRADGLTLTTLWYELQYPDILYPIKRFNAIDHYRMSHRNMLKVEGNFYKWIKGIEPINSIQKVTFTNGDSNKRFLPSFIRDLNTSISRLSSLFIEVYDESLEAPTTGFTFYFEGQFFAPDTFVFPYSSFYPLSDYFNVGDVVNLTNTVNAASGLTVTSITNVGIVYTITFSGSTFVDTAPLTIGTFVSISRGAPSNIVNATHEFNYIFKAR